jgi:hypothetical protein
MKFTMFLWLTFSLLAGCAESPCEPTKRALVVKMRAIDTCVASGLCTPTIEDFERAYALVAQAERYCPKETE